MRSKLLRELAALDLPQGPPPDSPSATVTETDLEPLPEPARRYLRFMGVVGRPRDWSFRLGYTGRFRLRRDGPWMRCEAWQHNSRPPVTRIFHIRVRVAGVVPLLGRDTYVRGRGRMLIRLLDLVTVGDAGGEEFDIGELVTYLNDGIMIAPSMLLAPEARWSPVDEGSFDVALTDHGRTVVGRVSVDQRGAPTDFSTTDRFAADPGDPKRTVRTRWTTPVEGWREAGDRRLWTRGRAVWHPPEGEFAYIEVTPMPETLAFNVPSRPPA